MLIFAICLYVFSITLANLLVAKFGPSVTPVLAFFLIGLDLTLRDWLHIRIKFWQMGLLIGLTGLLTYLLNPAAGIIAIGSSVAFIGAALVDWLIFAKLKGSWFKRSNGSNLGSAAIDSILFPTIAFGALMPGIVIAQFLAKVIGGFAWSLVFDKFKTK